MQLRAKTDWISDSMTRKVENTGTVNDSESRYARQVTSFSYKRDLEKVSKRFQNGFRIFKSWIISVF